MHVLLLVGIGVAGVVTAAIGRIRYGFVLVLVSTLLVPDTLRFPHTSAFLTIPRLVVFAFLFNLIRRAVVGEISVDVFRPTKLVAAFFLFLAVTFVLGVVLSPQDVPFIDSLFLWTTFVDSFLLFVAILAGLRAIGDVRWSARALLAIVAIMAAIGIIERVTKQSYAGWIFPRTRELANLPGAQGLEQRGGAVRVRVAAQFGLEYAWMATALVPLVLAVVVRTRRIVLACLIPATLVMSITFAYSRSAYFGVLVGVVILLLLSRFDARTTVVVAIGAVIALAALASSQTLSRTFGGREVVGSNQARQERLPVVLGDAAERPVLGLGFGALEQRGFGGTDASYLHLYGEIGVIGLSLLVILVGIAIGTAARGLRSPPEDGLIAGAAIAGLVVSMIGAAALDALTIPGSSRVVWLIAAFGAAVAGRAPARDPAVRRRPVLRAAVPAIGLAAGIAVFAFAPRPSSITSRFTTLPIRQLAAARDSRDFVGRINVATACGILETAARRPTSRADCFDLNTSVGVGEVRFQDDEDWQVEAHARAALATARRAVRGFVSFRTDTSVEARPTFARTAPVWGAGGGLLFALALPPLPIRRTLRLIGS